MGPTKPGGARLCTHCGDKFKIVRDMSLRGFLILAAISIPSMLLFTLSPRLLGTMLFSMIVFITVFMTMMKLDKY